MFIKIFVDCLQPKFINKFIDCQVGEASGDIIKGVGSNDADSSYEDALLALAKAVANATANLVLRAKAVANNTEEQALQNKVISMATQCALATSQLVGCTKVYLF